MDDREYVTANPHIHHLGWDTIWWAFTSIYAANWHPLTWLSHAIDYRIFGLSPAGHHLDSLFIHVLNVVLLFIGLRWTTRRVGPSFLVAALFALHPINVESVAWIAERKNVLSTFFFLFTLGSYVWYTKKPGWRRYSLMTALFVAGLMAKPMLVTMPFVLLLLDYWPLRRMQPDREGTNPAKGQRLRLLWLVLEKIPLLALSVASSYITLRAQRSAVRTFSEFSFVTRVENAIHAYGLYLWKIVWPAHLALYPYSLTNEPAWAWIGSSLVLIVGTIFVITFREKRYLLVGWFWFLGTLIPVIGLVQVGEFSMADRYAYIPLMGIFIMIAWGLADLAKVKNIGTAWCLIAASGALIFLASFTYRQIGYWQSDFDLWSHTLELEESAYANNAVGIALLNPDSEMTQEDLAGYTSESVRFDEARRHFERALELHRSQSSDASPWDMARSLNNLANLDRLQNRFDEARSHDEDALKIYQRLAQQSPDAYLPYLAATLNNLGSINRVQNRLEDAREDFDESLGIERHLAEQDAAKYLPNVAMMLNEFGMLDAAQNRLGAAQGHYEEALTIERRLVEQNPAVYLPQLAMTLTNFGVLDIATERMDDARQHYQQALAIDRQLTERNPAVYMPELAMALHDLARTEQLQNQIEQSRAHYEEALILLRGLVQENAKYAAQIAQIEFSLRELGNPSSRRK